MAAAVPTEPEVFCAGQKHVFDNAAGVDILTIIRVYWAAPFAMPIDGMCKGAIAFSKLLKLLLST